MPSPAALQPSPGRVSASTDSQPNTKVDADLLLKGGTIFDGSGSAGTIGDVAVRGERIVAVGSFDVGRIGRVIDCTGLAIAPGFIDLHTHSDRSVFNPATRNCRNHLMQGCTTCITGNCGLGPRDTAKYLDRVDSQGAGTNIVHLIPHGPLRQMGMGNAKRPAKPEEIRRMRTAIDEAMHAGAWGMSTGLEYNWSCYADLNELVELSKEVAAHGGIYASHIRDQSEGLIDAVAEAIEIGRLANVPVHVSHIKGKGLSYRGKVRDALALIEDARRRGQKVTADNYPYTVSCTGLDATCCRSPRFPEDGQIFSNAWSPTRLSPNRCVGRSKNSSPNPKRSSSFPANDANGSAKAWPRSPKSQERIGSKSHSNCSAWAAERACASPCGRTTSATR